VGRAFVRDVGDRWSLCVRRLAGVTASISRWSWAISGDFVGAGGQGRPGTTQDASTMSYVRTESPDSPVIEPDAATRKSTVGGHHLRPTVIHRRSVCEETRTLRSGGDLQERTRNRFTSVHTCCPGSGSSEVRARFPAAATLVLVAVDLSCEGAANPHPPTRN